MVVEFCQIFSKNVCFDHQFDVSITSRGFRQNLTRFYFTLLLFLRSSIIVFVEINDGKQQTKE